MYHPHDFQQQLLGSRAKPHPSDWGNSLYPGEYQSSASNHTYASIEQTHGLSGDEMTKLEHTQKVDTEGGLGATASGQRKIRFASGRWVKTQAPGDRVGRREH